MARKIKRLKSSDINRNSSIKISHTIEKIKAHERRYMLIVASIFMIIFIFIGYFLFRVNYTDNNYLASTNISYVLNSSVISITEDYIMSDSNGLKSDGFGVTFYNAEDEKINYELILKKDNFFTDRCGCNNDLSLGLLKYSIDKKNIGTVNSNEMVISRGVIDSYESKDINVKLWLNDQVSLNDDYHFHGRFVFRKVNNCE